MQRQDPFATRVVDNFSQIFRSNLELLKTKKMIALENESFSRFLRAVLPDANITNKIFVNEDTLKVLWEYETLRIPHDYFSGRYELSTSARTSASHKLTRLSFAETMSIFALALQSDSPDKPLAERIPNVMMKKNNMITGYLKGIIGCHDDSLKLKEILLFLGYAIKANNATVVDVFVDNVLFKQALSVLSFKTTNQPPLQDVVRQLVLHVDGSHPLSDQSKEEVLGLINSILILKGWLGLSIGNPEQTKNVERIRKRADAVRPPSVPRIDQVVSLAQQDNDSQGQAVVPMEQDAKEEKVRVPGLFVEIDLNKVKEFVANHGMVDPYSPRSEFFGSPKAIFVPRFFKAEPNLSLSLPQDSTPTELTEDELFFETRGFSPS
ncbi:MAG: hypothetical protein ACD_60C00099G0009 [uncultured bacterium]|nr:MAG: hypothetical protein ACD_60C00099G0009 [uncultured bacterium]